MSWDVHDDLWLAPIDPHPLAGVFDELDARVVAELLGSPPVEIEHSLPPPPPSAAFDETAGPTSYESGRFMVEDQPTEQAEPEHAEPEHAEPETEADELFGMVMPNLARLAPPSVPNRPPSVPPLIRSPGQGLGLIRPSELAASDDEPAFAIPSMRRPSGPSPVANELVIPSLRKPTLEATPIEDHLDVNLVPLSIDEHSGVVEDAEIEDVEEIEDVAEQPVRTGQTVVGPAPTGPPVSIGDSVYDDDDENGVLPATIVESASPDAISRVDSGELELLPDDEDTAVGYPPEEAAGGIEDPFLIPTLAAPVLGISPAELILPLMTRGQKDPELPNPPRPESEPEEAEEVEEFEVEEPASEVPGPSEALELPEPDAPEVRPPTPPPSATGPDKRRKAWYDDVFTEHYQFLYPPSWEATAARDAEFIHAVLGLPSEATVLDVGCGDGRHALELGKLGLRVTGLDSSLALLLAAAQHKEQMGVDDHVSFLHGDMRRLPRDRQFDAVICVGSTLGYFEEDQNRQCLEEMLARLTPTGRLLLHVFNRDFVAPQLPARSWWQGRRCMVLDEAEMNFFANRLRVHRTIIFDDGRQFEHYMFMRAFTVHDLGKTLSQLGMRVVEVSGSRDTRKRFYGSASPDIWIVAERKP